MPMQARMAPTGVELEAQVSAYDLLVAREALANL